jgi:beta-mannosidase
VVRVFGVNDTPRPWLGAVRLGLFTLSGALPLDETGPAVLAPNAATPLAEISRDRWEGLGLTRAGAFAVLLDAGGLPVAQHRLFLERFGDLEFADPRINLSLEGDRLTATSDAFAWGLCLDVDGELPLVDNCFDLVPRVPYVLRWNAEELGAPTVVRVGNSIVALRAAQGGH